MALLQDIPGYKFILKTVLQLQIKQLVDQLAEETGHECIVLLASISDRTLCQLGTRHGEEYLQNKDELKKDFLQHCLQKLESTTDTVCLPKDKISNKCSEHFDISTKKRRTSHKKKNAENHHNYSKKARLIDKGKTEKDLAANPELFIDEDDGRNKMADFCLDVDDTVNNGKNKMADLGSDYEDCVVQGSEKGNSSRMPIQARHKRKSDKAVQDIDDDDPDKSESGENEEFTETTTAAADDDDDDGNTEGNTSTTKQSGVKHKFLSGKALNEDLRTSLILQIIENGGDVKSGHVPRGVFTKVQKMYGVPATSSVTRIWEKYINDGTIAPRKGKGK